MDAIIKRISERLADRSSRRGFFSILGKAVLGAAALATGQGFFAQAAFAASLQCCTGTSCPSTGCPPHTQVGYTWTCSSSGTSYTCNDCYHGHGNGSYVCTYAA